MSRMDILGAIQEIISGDDDELAAELLAGDGDVTELLGAVAAQMKAKKGLRNVNLTRERFFSLPIPKQDDVAIGGTTTIEIEPKRVFRAEAIRLPAYPTAKGFYITSVMINQDSQLAGAGHIHTDCWRYDANARVQWDTAQPNDKIILTIINIDAVATQDWLGGELVGTAALR